MSSHLNVGHSGYGDSAEAAACWERWFYSENGREPRHLAFSEHQWRSIFGCEGGLVGREAISDRGVWLSDDEIQEPLASVLAMFFEEMWPVLRASTEALSAFVESNEHVVGDGLP